MRFRTPDFRLVFGGYFSDKTGKFDTNATIVDKILIAPDGISNVKLFHFKISKNEEAEICQNILLVAFSRACKPKIIYDTPRAIQLPGVDLQRVLFQVAKLTQFRNMIVQNCVF